MGCCTSVEPVVEAELDEPHGPPPCCSPPPGSRAPTAAPGVAQQAIIAADDAPSTSTPYGSAHQSRENMPSKQRLRLKDPNSPSPLPHGSDFPIVVIHANANTAQTPTLKGPLGDDTRRVSEEASPQLDEETTSALDSTPELPPTGLAYFDPVPTPPAAA